MLESAHGGLAAVVTRSTSDSRWQYDTINELFHFSIDKHEKQVLDTILGEKPLCSPHSLGAPFY
jgi:hypothetical protein